MRCLRIISLSLDLIFDLVAGHVKIMPKPTVDQPRNELIKGRNGKVAEFGSLNKNGSGQTDPLTPQSNSAEDVCMAGDGPYTMSGHIFQV